MMKKVLAWILCAGLLFGSIACADDMTTTLPADAVSAPETENAGAADSGAGERWFVFNPKVRCDYMDEMFPGAMAETWYNLVDAVMAGEDTFACETKLLYDWVTGQFPDRYFPVLVDIIDPAAGGMIGNGVAKIGYKVSREESAKAISGFIALVEDIVNTAVQPYYTDLEKALSLYLYFSKKYVYDYDTYYQMNSQYLEYISAYRLLTGGTGICQEISAAYSYLLMQVGVSATIMMGDSDLTGEGHQWSYVRLNGKNYHIDPTYALSDPGTLEFFMMSDKKRAEEYPPEEYVVGSNFTTVYPHPDYRADDDSLTPLWHTRLISFDHDAGIMHCLYCDLEGNSHYVDFSYSDTEGVHLIPGSVQ